MVKDLLRSVFKIPFLEKMILRYNTGRLYGSGFTKLTPNHYSYPPSSIRKVSRNGVNYELDLSDIVDWSIYFGFREIEKEKLFDLDPNPHTIIDVGANIGEVSLRFAGKYPNASVYGFEPHPGDFRKAKKQPITEFVQKPEFVKLWARCSKSEVHFEERAVGNPGMNRVTSDPTKSAHRILITTLDSFITENEIPTVSVIKIDVEGYEHEVLKGAVDLLTRFKPALFIELDDSNLMEQGSSAADFIQFIESFGYVIEHSETGEIVTEDSPLKIFAFRYYL